MNSETQRNIAALRLSIRRAEERDRDEGLVNDYADLRSTFEALARDAVRYRRLRMIGCAVYERCVSRFEGLDAIVDKDLAALPHRGEAK